MRLFGPKFELASFGQRSGNLARLTQKLIWPETTQNRIFGRVQNLWPDGSVLENMAKWKSVGNRVSRTSACHGV
jgi:hypothetical protein